MLFFEQQGYRVIAHDRRGSGRSQQTWSGNEFNTFADDLAQLIEKFDLTNAVMVGHSAGTRELVRYISRHERRGNKPLTLGTCPALFMSKHWFSADLITKVVLMSAITPHMLRTDDQPIVMPQSVFDSFHSQISHQRAQFFKDTSRLFYGFNRPGVTVIQGFLDDLWLQDMKGSIKAEHDGITSMSEDFTEDLKKIDKPTLVLHGDDDQVVPSLICALPTAEVIPGPKLIVYPGYPHGMVQLYAKEISQDILAIIKQSPY